MNTVLVVDDNATGRKLLRAVLEPEGYRVIEAVDGRAALGVLEHQPVDAIITDLLMPNFDGYRLCREVRQEERWRHLAFLIYTATYTAPGDEKLGFELGADAYLRKPASAAALLGALRAALRQTERSRPQVAHTEFDVLNEYSQRLVDKLGEKNLELEQKNRELEQKNRELEQKDRLAELAAEVGVALVHDFNNLLLVILGQSEILAMNSAPEDPRRGSLAEIGRAVERAAALTRQLLTFSRQRVVEPTVLDPSVVHGIVRQSGGHVDAGNLPGVDTTFKIHLPALEGTPADPVPSGPAAPPPGGRETILLVEDEGRVRATTALMLRSLGYAVLEASDAQGALRLAEASPSPIDLLLTDVIMPGRDGREAADELRRRCPGLKVLFQSGYGDEAVNRHVGVAEGAFLQKPFRLEALAQKVRERLGQP